MKSTAAQRNLMIILFVLVLVTFSFAQRDSKKLEQLYTFILHNTTPGVAQKAPLPAADN